MRPGALTLHSVSTNVAANRWVVWIVIPPSRDRAAHAQRLRTAPAYGGADGCGLRARPARRLEQLERVVSTRDRALGGGDDPAGRVAHDEAEGRRRAPADVRRDVLLAVEQPRELDARRTGTRAG